MIAGPTDPEGNLFRIELQDAWRDGYTPEEAGPVLEALNALIAAAGLPGRVWLLWEMADEYGPGGDSDLYYVIGQGENTHIVQASEIYSLVDGGHNPRPFLEWVDRVCRAEVEFVHAPHFPYLKVGQYQGVDTCVSNVSRKE